MSHKTAIYAAMEKAAYAFLHSRRRGSQVNPQRVSDLTQLLIDCYEAGASKSVEQIEAVEDRLMKTFAGAHFAVETPPGEVELDASTYFTNKAYTVSEADTDMAEPVEVLAMRPDEAAEKWAAICDYEAGGAPIAVDGLKVRVKVALGNDVRLYEVTGSCDYAYEYSCLPVATDRRLP